MLTRDLCIKGWHYTERFIISFRPYLLFSHKELYKTLFFNTFKAFQAYWDELSQQLLHFRRKHFKTTKYRNSVGCFLQKMKMSAHGDEQIKALYPEVGWSAVAFPKKQQHEDPNRASTNLVGEVFLVYINTVHLPSMAPDWPLYSHEMQYHAHNFTELRLYGNFLFDLWIEFDIHLNSVKINVIGMLHPPLVDQPLSSCLHQSICERPKQRENWRNSETTSCLLVLPFWRLYS